ncbi:cytochrome ubiquinol oxidase subunit I [Companilactobacillus versmoldensis]|uniref:Cytochrome bd-type quinol oxidase subunit 1 n=1 Tax=Companilactobacillus versmoldensis DSM 14857 = KCTC 3814 TaxID=1423815 RepID=A0A0R1SKD7_9LACO|nr:cytochrome ubiquinol oxidase subunit I [Companilactobacillus versmoldensis]KRL67178.1 cytochrome bd-type quinol oxidase subunit 1 [Companilactobacillus versmoldensis DSM 14857 = KCTC 3814]
MFGIGLTIVGLARFQFAMTTVFHFFFVPFSIGMGFVVAIMETIYAVKKDKVYRDMAKFWGKIFLLSFAVGIVTGLIQEFQFGMNWSEYSRFMGDVFGAPLAIEALLAFFIESVFIGIWMFTWDRFSPGWHAFMIWMTSIGTMLSAIWILAANSFMQHPTGFTIAVMGGRTRIKLTSFGDVVANPQLWRVFPHLIIAAIMTAGVVIAGMSAYGLLRKKNGENHFFKTSLRYGLWVGLIGSILTIFAGDFQTQQMIKDQPMKFAATEGIYQNTKDPAPWTVIETIDAKGHKASHQVEIPKVLSLLTYHKGSGAVKGMNQINKELNNEYGNKKFGTQMGSELDFYPPAKTLFWSFRIMTAVAFLVLLFDFLGLLFSRKSKDTIENKKWLLYCLGIGIWIPFIGNSAGWFVTEFGRYPWIVYGLFTISQAVSPSSTIGSLLFSNILYFLLFAFLGGVMVWYSRQTLHQGPYFEEKDSKQNVDPFAKEAFGK